jgi:xanthine dehydrogenase accessory factor
VNSTAYDLREKADQLRSDRRPFVTATVVRAEKPTSAKAGDSALVLDDGTVIGFIGGECAHTSVQVQALAALEVGDPVLLRISPDAVAPGAVPQ